MQIGYEFLPVEKEEITHTQLVKYAGASGDFNPIHTVVPFAEEVGLNGAIAHGMLVMGFIGEATGTWFPDQELLELDVRFKAMTRPGETITVSGRIVEEQPEYWGCEAYAKNEEEVKVSAAFRVKKT
ncbi:MaoC/PaaZ C-terminal domain-containing protein [Planococcus glaciei]|uniref:MaoC/PaaZ C-terminal domain-containing protein n=1 Tax=Planococcus glaciei TaxID=459472 RepID=UPI001C72E515|nr:MaoC/PaaZ C-terminal domain-containing protein [Planococcus glaciei]MBX0315425.1 MaoC family dehydratase N-terminal domain-containing protein [Planococcus glaciei]